LPKPLNQTRSARIALEKSDSMDLARGPRLGQRRGEGTGHRGQQEVAAVAHSIT
jgi:hypothetical protein